MGPPSGVPRSGGSVGPPPGNFVNLDCKSLILGTSRAIGSINKPNYCMNFLDF